jgi:hypothetical protein
MSEVIKEGEQYGDGESINKNKERIRERRREERSCLVILKARKSGRKLIGIKESRNGRKKRSSGKN